MFLNPKLNYRIKFGPRFEHCSMRNDIAQLVIGKHKVITRKFNVCFNHEKLLLNEKFLLH